MIFSNVSNADCLQLYLISLAVKLILLMWKFEAMCRSAPMLGYQVGDKPKVAALFFLQSDHHIMR